MPDLNLTSSADFSLTQVETQNVQKGFSSVRSGLRGWVRHPQKRFLRRALFQIHLWSGIFISLYAVAIGISGSVLVFQDEISAAFIRPATFQVPISDNVLPSEQTLRTVKAAYPAYKASYLTQLSRPGRAACLYLALLQPGTSDTKGKLVYFNPATGRVLAQQDLYPGVMGWFSKLHYFLLMDRKGLTINGIGAAMLCLLCLSGIIVWWPGLRRWKSSLGVKVSAGWKRVNWDLHSSVGFWSCLALLLVSLTGVYFAFPLAIGASVVGLTGGSIQKAKLSLMPVQSAPATPGTPVLSIDRVYALSRQLLPPNTSIDMVGLPFRPSDTFSLTARYHNSLPYAESIRLSFDSHTGKLLKQVDTHQQELGLRSLGYVHTVHFGSFGGDGLLGVTIKALWVLLGLTPALLSVTGLIMYWNRKLAPALRRRRARRANALSGTSAS